MFFGSYAAIVNQAYHLGHFALAFTIAYILLPLLMFKPVEGNRMDTILANFLRMSLFVIIVGYLLIVTKLLEFIGFAVAIVTWILLTKGRQRGMNSALSVVVALFYDLIETPYLIRQGISKVVSWFKREDGPRFRLPSRQAIRGVFTIQLIYPLLLVVIIGVSVYLRWTDAVTNAAPPMSDGDVILAWVKYVNLRILFHDGIYPQGYFIIDDFISKFAFINALYVVKYMGAMATTLIIIGLYYVGSRLGRTYQAAGLIAALIYGIFGYTLLQGEWARQAATETQEFGFAFAIPTIYFAYRYFRSGEKRELGITFAGLAVSGLIHVLSYMLTLVGCISVLLAFLLFDRGKKWGRYGLASLIGVASGLISLAPMELGRLYHRQVNGASASFATATVAGNSGGTVAPTASFRELLPKLTPMDEVAVVAIAILLIASLVATSRGRREIGWLSVGVFGALMFAIYYVGGAITNSAVISSRSIDIWGVAGAFVIGYAVQVLADGLVHPVLQVTEKVALLGVVLVPQVLHSPHPIIPYKMQWGTDVEQYLRIDAGYRNSGYMIVSPDDEYALVIGSGYHMATGDFVSMYDPALRPLTRFGQSKPDTNIAPNVFIYYHTDIFELPKTDLAYPIEEPIYKQEYSDRAKLTEWLKAYRQVHGHITVFYRGPHLIVYYIHNDVTDVNSAAKGSGSSSGQ